MLHTEHDREATDMYLARSGAEGPLPPHTGEFVNINIYCKYVSVVLCRRSPSPPLRIYRVYIKKCHPRLPQMCQGRERGGFAGTVRRDAD
uniref:Uncharacterized protein n=1 Tax=Knipowitschia caucasica TaxID=637954 RepID=A0AAV2LUY9_KNICA